MKAKKEEELLECPICWRSFNLVENIPYILWCGHTLCKTCILSIQCAAVRLPHSLYHVHGANYFPSELFGKVSFDFLGRISFYSGWWKVQMAIRIDFARLPALMRKRFSHHQVAHQFVKVDLTLHQSKAYTDLLVPPEQEKGQVVLYAAGEFVRHCVSHWLCCCTSLQVLLCWLVGWLLITFLFALPSFLVLYFSCPILNWLVREIIA